MKNKMAEDRAEQATCLTCSAPILKCGVTGGFFHRWRHRDYVNHIIARELTERALPANLARSARETSLRLTFYFLSRLVSFSHRQLNQFWNKHYKCLLLYLSLLNLTEMREPSRALSMISHKKGKKIAILTHATARRVSTAHGARNWRQHDKRNQLNAHEMMQYFRGKKRQLESISCRWHKSLVPSHSSMKCHLFSFARAFTQMNPARFQRRFYSSDLSRLISKRFYLSNYRYKEKRATWGKSRQK